MSTISQKVTVKASIVIEDEKIDYQKLVKPSLTQGPVYIKYLFFISHASLSSQKTESERQLLEGEADYVRLLVEKLEKYKLNSTYVDYRDNPNFEFSVFHAALKTSQYGVFICSPRFKDRYLSDSASFLKEEVKHFWTLKNTHHQPERQIPIMFGLELIDYDSGPFSSSDFMINAEYGKVSLKQMVDKVASKIIEKINN